MAEKKAATKAETKTVKPVVITDNVTGDIYVLEFNRDTVKFAEAKKFDINALDSGEQIMTNIEELFYYSFRMHQPSISRAETDKILYDKLGGVPQGLIERLAQLYLVPYQSLVRDEDKAKNSQMTVEF